MIVENARTPEEMVRLNSERIADRINEVAEMLEGGMPLFYLLDQFVSIVLLASITVHSLHETLSSPSTEADDG